MRFSCGVLDKQCFVNVILLKCQYRGTMLMHYFLPSWAMLDMQSLHSRQFSRISLCIDCLSVWKSRQMRQVPLAPKNQRASMNLWFDCVFFSSKARTKKQISYSNGYFRKLPFDCLWAKSSLRSSSTAKAEAAWIYLLVEAGRPQSRLARTELVPFKCWRDCLSRRQFNVVFFDCRTKTQY